MLPLLPVMALFFPALTLNDVGKAMIRCVLSGAPKRALEVPDIAGAGECQWLISEKGGSIESTGSLQA